MTAGAYYNEHDEFAADWLRNLIKAGLIADGEVDTRSIVDVRADDVRDFSQCHFFAGIGGWSYALRKAGWDDSRPAWTGSCPCQPFSLAGAQRGFADERHLWPVWRDLVEVVRPSVLFGEQVASATEWLRLVRGDLEAMGYAVGAIPIQAASAGADHLRDRYWFVADASGSRLAVGSIAEIQRGDVRLKGTAPAESGTGSCHVGLADSCGGSQGQQAPKTARHGRAACAAGSDVSNAARQQVGTAGQSRQHGDVEWVIGADGKARRVGPDLRRLVDGLSEFLGGVRDECYKACQEEVIAYGQAKAIRPSEVLRALQERVLSKSATYEAMGESQGVRGAEILFSFLRELSHRTEESNGAFSGAEAFNAAMRSLRYPGKAECSPLRRGLSEQCTEQYSDALHELSCLLAQHARTAWDAHKRQNAKALPLLMHGVPNRVGLLRGFGNAIDPRPAAAFIEAYMTASALPQAQSSGPLETEHRGFRDVFQKPSD